MLYRRSLEIELRLGTALRERGHTIRFGQREDGWRSVLVGRPVKSRVQAPSDLTWEKL